MYDEFLRKTNSESFMRVKAVPFLIYDPGQTIVDYFHQTNNTSKPIVDKNIKYSVPTEAEIKLNNRARSAKLRIAEKK
jgi:16S rRNA C1402 N4-methylase RsmH